MNGTDLRTGLVTRQAELLDPRTVLDEGALVAASRNAFPVVAQRKARSDGMGLAAGVGAALLLGGVTFWSMSAHRTPPAAPAPVPLVQPAARPPVAVAVPLPPPAPPRPLLFPSSPPLANAPLERVARAPAPIVVFDTGSVPTAAPMAGQTAPQVTPAPLAGRTGTPAGGTDNEQFAARVGDNGVEVASAHQLSDPGTTIAQGTLIAAVLETAINTDLPGYVRAIVAQDVRSFDGSRVIVPRSSRLIGQYKSGLADGQRRAYVIWTRLIRPDGVSVALASPATDFAGRSGLDGKVDSHFMQRFGSAALLSVVSGLAAVGNSALVISGGQSAASVAAQHDTAIPPTIKVPQGQPIRIFTARDLDFSGVGNEAPSAQANG